jgi:electron transport complex protein RnfB
VVGRWAVRRARRWSGRAPRRSTFEDEDEHEHEDEHEDEMSDPKPIRRRDLLRLGLSGAAALALGGLGAVAVARSRRNAWVWQLDPRKCVQCGGCATNCAIEPSAVKCVHAFALCGYCKLCFGYFRPGAPALTSGAENQLCPAGAIRRRFVEDPYYEYAIDEALCTGCAKCVKGCTSFGNGSLFLQVRLDRCLRCNECSIARKCPAQAWRRVPADRPYLLKGEG